MQYFWIYYDRSTYWIYFLHFLLDNIKVITCIWGYTLLENIKSQVNCVINNSCTVDPNVSKTKITHTVKYVFNFKIKISMKYYATLYYISVKNFWTEINRYRRIGGRSVRLHRQQVLLNKPWLFFINCCLCLHTVLKKLKML